MSEDTIFEISIPIDEDGFELLKCPLCGELFKLHSNDYRDESVFQIYCPACGLVSEDYLTDDVLELGMTMMQNHVNDLFFKSFKKFEAQTQGSIISFQETNESERQTEQPITLTIENLEKYLYPCCKMEAKIKPILKMSGSYCIYCGVFDYGIE